MDGESGSLRDIFATVLTQQKGENNLGLPPIVVVGNGNVISLESLVKVAARTVEDSSQHQLQLF